MNTVCPSRVQFYDDPLADFACVLVSEFLRQKRLTRRISRTNFLQYQESFGSRPRTNSSSARVTVVRGALKLFKPFVVAV